jgi:thiol-disulfide isomerase/thioredoxin
MSKYLLYLSLLSPFLGVAQQIKGVFSPANAFKTTILYHLSEGKTNYVSYGVVNTNGEMQIELEASAPAGMYRLVYALPQSENNFEFIYSGKPVLFNFKNETGVEFTNSKENQLLQSYNQLMANAQNDFVQLYAQPTLDTLNYKLRVQKIDSLQNAYERLSKGTIAAHFISATKPYIPSKIETVSEYISNVKTKYFEAIDFEDPILQNSNFLIDKSIDYILRMHTSATPLLQDYKDNIDIVSQQLSTTKPSFQLTNLVALNDLLIESQYEAMALYLTKTYLLPLAIQLKDFEQISNSEEFMRIAIGVKAPDFKVNNQTSLYDLEDAANYLLIFWSSDCGHCLKELPKIYSYLESHPEKNFKVVAIGLEITPDKWNKTIKFWPQFTHVIAKGKWDSKLSKLYAVKATPSYYLLDASKTITSKPYHLKDLMDVLDQK